MRLAWTIVILLAVNAATIGAMLLVRRGASLAVVLFVSSLSFAGISTRLRSQTTRTVILGLGCALFLGAVVWIATFPVSLSV